VLINYNLNVKNQFIYVFIFSKSIDLDLTETHLTKILEWSINRITNINELVHDNYKFIWMKPSKSALKSIDYDKGNKYRFLQNYNINNYLF